MPDQSVYYAPAKLVRCRFSEQGSRFTGTLIPAATEEDAKEALQELSEEYPDATHHAFAYRIRVSGAVVERASDDGEPAGTAGPPMLQQLQGGNIADALVVGTRYYGGVKLGIGGLTRAYRECARLCITEAAFKKKEPLDKYRLTISYEDLGAVTRLLESLGGQVLKADYTEHVCLRLCIPTRSALALLNGFESATRGRGKWEKE